MGWSAESILRKRASTTLRVERKCETVPKISDEQRGWWVRGILWRFGIMSVQAEGIIERLPSGRTRVKYRAPRR
jgi:hypothetical protein